MSVTVEDERVLWERKQRCEIKGRRGKAVGYLYELEECNIIVQGVEVWKTVEEMKDW